MIKHYIKLLRAPQWIKNAFVWVPLVFSHHIFETPYIVKTLHGFVIFCLISSSVYIINDIVDRESDRRHPRKKNRPIASGAVSINQALILLSVILAGAIVLSVYVDNRFRAVALAYFVINLSYTFRLKHLVLLDIFSIAAGFMLRVIAGAFVINVEISSWLLLTTMFISLFLGVMKRRSELILMNDENHSTTRKVLESYTVGFTDQMATLSAAAVIICYALYTTAQRTVDTFKTEHLIYTTPFVVYGIFRYMYLVYKHDQGENTTEIMLSDVPMIVNILLYLIFTLQIIYKVI